MGAGEERAKAETPGSMKESKGERGMERNGHRGMGVRHQDKAPAPPQKRPMEQHFPSGRKNFQNKWIFSCSSLFPVQKC